MIRSNTLFNFVCYHPDEHQILTTGTDRKIGYWEAFDGSMIRELDGSSGGSINTMDISADGKYFVSGGDDRLIKVTILHVKSIPFKCPFILERKRSFL